MRRAKWLILLVALEIALLGWARASPSQVEQYYSRGFFPYLASFLNVLFGWLPFSLAELLLGVALLLAAALLLQGLGRLRHLADPRDIFFGLLRLVAEFACLGLTLHLTFLLCWGLNLYRLPLGVQLGWELQPVAAQEVQELTWELVELANRERALVAEDAEGVAKLREDTSYFTVFWEGMESYGTSGQGSQMRAKPVILSPLMSYTFITGFYFPFTGEANINTNVPGFELPATVAHEIAHKVGVAREDEANFVAWKQSRLPGGAAEVAYSGSLRALVYALNAVYTVSSPEEYRSYWQAMTPGVQRDLEASRSFWDKYSGTVQTVSEQINDTYLKGHQQVEGVRSYGRFIDLLIAERRYQEAATAR
ncbi:MAG: DUF3810 domain-containing protein [Symbiobacteriaceae bacterium]|nr:DUF3810 domain-containing protein [Symbiobacteriaceae bacterium]